MTVETQDVFSGGAKTAVRVIYIDPQSRRYQADIPIAQATADAVSALGASLAAQAAALMPAVTTQTDAQALTAAQVIAAIASTMNDNSPASDPAE